MISPSFYQSTRTYSSVGDNYLFKTIASEIILKFGLRNDFVKYKIMGTLA